MKTLYGFGTFFLLIGSIAMLVAVIGFIMYLSNLKYSSSRENALIGLSLASAFFPIAIGSFAGGSICKGLSTIAETALYKKALLEEQYYFEESDSFEETEYRTDY